MTHNEIEACIPMAVGMAKRFARTKPWVELDEAVAVALCALCEAARIHQTDGSATLSTYARKHIYGRLVESNRRRPTVHLSEVEQVECHRRGQQTHLDDVDESSWVLDQLKPRDRQRVKLRFWDGMTYPEIAARTNRSRTVVAETMMRLRQLAHAR